MAKQKIRIRLKAYEHRILDQSADKIVETKKENRCSNFRSYSVANGTHIIYGYPFTTQAQRFS